MGVCARDVAQEQTDLPVSVTNGYGKVITHTLQVTVWRDSANPQPSPILVLNHGRPAEPQGRAELVGRSSRRRLIFFCGAASSLRCPPALATG